MAQLQRIAISVFLKKDSRFTVLRLNQQFLCDIVALAPRRRCCAVWPD